MSGALQRRRERVARFWLEDYSLSFLLAFVTLIVFVLGPLHEIDVAGRLVVGIIFNLVLISGVLVTATSRPRGLLIGSVTLVALGVHWADFLFPDLGLRLADAVASLVTLIILAAVVLAQTVREGQITHRRIQGAIVVYLLVGVIFGFAYTIIWMDSPDAFVMDGGGAAHLYEPLNRVLVYFSFVTLTTVGYGDVHPVHSVARSLANLESVIGQLYPAILLARLVSMEMYYRQRRFEREQAALDREAVARQVAKILRDELK